MREGKKYILNPLKLASYTKKQINFVVTFSFQVNELLTFIYLSFSGLDEKKKNKSINEKETMLAAKIVFTNQKSVDIFSLVLSLCMIESLDLVKRALFL
jgi:hypothetical protein